jgi:hypothetical protein
MLRGEDRESNRSMHFRGCGSCKLLMHAQGAFPRFKRFLIEPATIEVTVI